MFKPRTVTLVGIETDFEFTLVNKAVSFTPGTTLPLQLAVVVHFVSDPAPFQ
jgi:hypothetical protein